MRHSRRRCAVARAARVGISESSGRLALRIPGARTANYSPGDGIGIRAEGRRQAGSAERTASDRTRAVRLFLEVIDEPRARSVETMMEGSGNAIVGATGSDHAWFYGCAEHQVASSKLAGARSDISVQTASRLAETESAACLPPGAALPAPNAPRPTPGARRASVCTPPSACVPGARRAAARPNRSPQR